MGMILMRLGPFRFSISEFNLQEVERNFSYRWEPMDRVGRRPALQFLGPGMEEITLTGTIYPHYFGGMGQYNKMRNSAKSGTPFSLVSGTGSHLGLFCITELSDTNSSLLKNGAPRKREFTISLSAYGEDGLGFGGAAGGLFRIIGGSLFGGLAGGVSSLAGGIAAGTLGYAVAGVANSVGGKGVIGAIDAVVKSAKNLPEISLSAAYRGDSLYRSVERSTNRQNVAPSQGR